MTIIYTSTPLPPPSSHTLNPPSPQTKHTGAFVLPAGMNKAELEKQAVWPSQAADHPDKLIKLPGQTKVGEQEYKEFLNLGHGGVFDLDLSRYVCVCVGGGCV